MHFQIAYIVNDIKSLYIFMILSMDTKTYIYQIYIYLLFLGGRLCASHFFVFQLHSGKQLVFCLTKTAYFLTFPFVDVSLSKSLSGNSGEVGGGGGRGEGGCRNEDCLVANRAYKIDCLQKAITTILTTILYSSEPGRDSLQNMTKLRVSDSCQANTIVTFDLSVKLSTQS